MKKITAAFLLCVPFVAQAVTYPDTNDALDDIDFPAAGISFADSTSNYIEGPNDKTPPTDGVADWNADPLEALGPPNRGATFLSLGKGGSVILEFTNNALTADDTSADDLWIFEVGDLTEATKVEISEKGSTWIDLGNVSGSTSGLDLDSFAAVKQDTKYYFVRVTDDPTLGSHNYPIAGADIDSVGAISTETRCETANTETTNATWYEKSTGNSRTWDIITNAIDSIAYHPNMNIDFKPLALGDFDNDGDNDVLWRNEDTGENTIWIMNNNTYSSSNVIDDLDLPWYRFVTVADFDNDGDDDIWWHKFTTGENRIWIMEAGVKVSEVYPNAISTYFCIEVAADFDNDGDDDILWQKTNGETRIWLMDNGVITQTEYLPYMNTAYQIEGTGDFDNDGDADILIHNPSTGQNTIWEMENGIKIAEAYLPLFKEDGNGNTFKIESVGDYNQDGYADILWRNQVTGQIRIWEIINNLQNDIHYISGTIAPITFDIVE